MDEPAPPFRSFRSDPPRSPVVIGVPHAGTLYPPELLAMLGVPRTRIELLEDPLVDRLVAPAIADGAAAVIATRARAWIDLNRDPREIDPAMIAGDPGAVLPSAKVRAGLGLVPRRAQPGADIYRARIPAASVHARIVEEHAPYHAALEAALMAARARFGVAVLLDCHSMPPLAPAGGREPATVVIGDRHGRSAATRFADAIADAAEGGGQTVAFNVPYAGGYTLNRHGRPGHGIHAVQLELSRALYLDAQLRAEGCGFDACAELVRAVVAALAQAALGTPDRLAAE